MVKKKAKKNGKGKPKEDEESFEEDSEEEKPKSKARKNKKAPIKNSTPIVKVEDNKVMVDEKFKDKNKYHVLKDDNNVYNGKIFSCKLLINENNSNKYFIIQLLKNDSKNSFSLFTRWGKIGSDGQQKVESVDSTSGPKLFMKKYTEKINKGFIEEAGEKKVENGTQKSNQCEELFQQILELFKKKTGKPCYSYEESVVENLGFLDDKIGGHPYLPKGVKYPKTSNGKHMALLLQINLTKYQLDGFPKKGIFEIFHQLDAGDGRTSEYKTFLFDETLEFQTKFPNIDYSDFFCEKPVKLIFKKNISYMNFYDNNFEPTVLECIEEITKKKYNSLSEFYKDYNINEMDFVDVFQGDGFAQCGLGVYPDFIQEDTRRGDTKNYVNIFGFTSSENTFFNDCARGWILIDKDDLKNGKVENAIFEYDMT